MISTAQFDSNLCFVNLMSWLNQSEKHCHVSHHIKPTPCQKTQYDYLDGWKSAWEGGQTHLLERLIQELGSQAKMAHYSYVTVLPDLSN